VVHVEDFHHSHRLQSRRCLLPRRRRLTSLGKQPVPRRVRWNATRWPCITPSTDVHPDRKPRESIAGQFRLSNTCHARRRRTRLARVIGQPIRPRVPSCWFHPSGAIRTSNPASSVTNYRSGLRRAWLILARSLERPRYTPSSKSSRDRSVQAVDVLINLFSGRV
jgi:hypothetical protein